MLAKTLAGLGLTMSVETNGTLDVPPARRSPQDHRREMSGSGESEPPAPLVLSGARPGDEFKFVLTARDDFDFAVGFARSPTRSLNAERFFFLLRRFHRTIASRGLDRTRSARYPPEPSDSPVYMAPRIQGKVNRPSPRCASIRSAGYPRTWTQPAVGSRSTRGGQMLKPKKRLLFRCFFRHIADILGVCAVSESYVFTSAGICMS